VLPNCNQKGSTCSTYASPIPLQRLCGLAPGRLLSPVGWSAYDSRQCTPPCGPPASINCTSKWKRRLCRSDTKLVCVPCRSNGKLYTECAIHCRGIVAPFQIGHRSSSRSLQKYCTTAATKLEAWPLPWFYATFSKVVTSYQPKAIVSDHSKNSVTLVYCHYHVQSKLISHLFYSQ
jgi:hypothetical protein